MYEADPFLAFEEREQAKDRAAKEREKRKLDQDAARKDAQPGMPRRAGQYGDGKSKAWSNVPKVELGNRTRKEIERLVRRYVIWNPRNATMDPTLRSKVVDEVSTLGFRRSHVEEAAEICKDREEMLEWLLIHVPEDDLPRWSLPENYVAGVSVASQTLKREGAVQRLALAGFATDLCEEAYDAQGGDEAKAAAVLQARLLRPDDDADVAQGLQGLALDHSDDAANAWQEEQASLAAIYDDRLEAPSPCMCRIQLETPAGNLILQARKPFGPYPAVLPILSVEAALPAHVRLSILKQALLHAEANCLGMAMLFDVVDWLEQNVPGIAERPGRLTDVSSGIAAADSGSRTKTARRRTKARRRPPVNWQPGTEASLRMLSEWQARQKTPQQQQMMKTRQSLPAWSLRDAIVRTVERHRVCIISGETGSGKSTQSVQFLLDDFIQRQLGGAANLVCTQPRRISALGLADRVAAERCSAVGQEIGFAIRGESKQAGGRHPGHVRHDRRPPPASANGWQLGRRRRAGGRQSCRRRRSPRAESGHGLFAGPAAGRPSPAQGPESSSDERHARRRRLCFVLPRGWARRQGRDRGAHAPGRGLLH